MRARAAARRSNRQRMQFEALEPRVLLSADLVGNVQWAAGVTLFPGDHEHATVVVQNVGDDATSGRVDVSLYASADGVLDASDILLDTGKATGRLKPGASKDVKLNFTLPDGMLPGEYTLFAVVDPVDRVHESNETNNVDVGPQFDLAWMFGNAAGHGHESLLLRDADGTRVLFSLAGPGTGEISVEDGQWNVELTGTSGSSTFTVLTQGGGDRRVVLDDIHVAGPLKALFAPEMDLTGTLAFDGPLGTGLVIGSATDAVISVTAISGPEFQGHGHGHGYGHEMGRGFGHGRDDGHHHGHHLEKNHDVALGGITILGDLDDSQILIGAKLGADGKLGGTGAAADMFSSGELDRLFVGGSMLSSQVRVGQDPVNGVFDDCDDIIQGGEASRLGAIVVGGELSADSRIIAGTLPALARVDHHWVPTAGDARFKTDVTGPEVELALANDTGESASDGLTFDPSVNGSALDPSGIVALQASFDGSASVDILDELGADGSFSLSQQDLETIYGAALADGSYTLTVSATDGQNNTCAYDLTFALDATAPTATVEQAAMQADPTNDGPILFAVEFSEPVLDFTAEDVSLAGSTVGGTLGVNVSGSGASYTVAVDGMDGIGTVIASVVAVAANDAAGNSSEASTSADNTVLFDNVAPTVIIDQAAAQPDPINDGPVVFTVEFSEPVVGFAAEDVDLAGSTVGGTLGVTVAGGGASYTVAVAGMDGVGTVVASVVAGAASDAAGNSSEASTSTDNTVLFDNVAPTVAIDQAAAQEDPTNDGPVLFTVEFSEPVVGFTASDVSLAGSTVGGTLAVGVAGSGASYSVTVTGMNGVGTVVASVPAGQASDAAGNSNTASTSVDNTVFFDNVAPTVAINQAAAQEDPTTESPIVFDVVFSEAVTGFTAGDVSFAGSTAGDDFAVAVTGSGANYTVSVSGMDATGDVIASIPAGAASDAAGNTSSASTSTDNTVGFESGPANAAPTFTLGDGVVLVSGFSGRSVALLPDGRIVAGSSVVARLNLDGSLDTSFDGDGMASVGLSGSVVVVQGDGKVVAAGSTDIGNANDFVLVRFNPNGSLDTTFDTDGRVTTDFGVFLNDTANALALQSDGKLVVAGFTTTSGTSTDFALARYNTDGSLDTSFDDDGKLILDMGSTVDRANAVLIQPDGKILVGGMGGSILDFALARLNSDGSLDTSFGTGGKVSTAIGASTDSISALALQSDGKILAAGFASGGGFALARYNSNGTLDTTFDTDGKLTLAPLTTSAQGRGVVVQPDGKIVVVGRDSNGSVNVMALARFNANGSLDTSFDGDGKLTLAMGAVNSEASDAVVQSDGRIVVVGSSPNTGEMVLARINPNGSLDLSFDTAVNTLDASPIFTRGGPAVVLDGDVRVYDADLALVGHYGGASLTLARAGGANATDVFSAAAGGTLGALTQGTSLVVSGTTIGTVTTNSGGTLVLAFNSSATQARVESALQQIAYSNSSGTLPATVQLAWGFNDGNTGTQGTGGALVATGSTLVHINNVPTGGVTISGTPTEGQTLSAVSTLADADGLGTLSYQWQVSGFGGAAWTNIATATGSTLALTDAYLGKQLRVIVSYTDGGGTPESATSAATAAVANQNAAPSFVVGDGKVTRSIGVTDTADDALLQPDGKLVVVGLDVVPYSSNGPDSRYELVRYNTDGSVDVTNATPISTFLDMRSVALQSDGKILAVGSRTTGTITTTLVRYNANGSLDTSFDGDGKLSSSGFFGTSSGGAGAVLALPDGKIMLAGNGSSSTYSLARLNADGSFDTTFSDDGKITGLTGVSFVADAVLQPDGKILIAGLSTFGWTLARHNPDGSLDTTFDTDGVASTFVASGATLSNMALQADGKIVLVGTANSNIALARFNANGSLDTSFDTDGKLLTDFAPGNEGGGGVLVQADGKIVVAGFAFNGPNDDFALARYNADGTLDTTFDDDGKVLTDFAGGNDQAVRVLQQADGRYLVVGTATLANQDQAVARYNANGSLDLFYGTRANTLDATPTYNQDAPAVVLDANVRVYDPDLATTGNYGGATLTLARNGGASAEDVFSAKPGGTLGALTQGTSLTVGGTTIGTVTTNSGGTLVLTFNANATQALLDATLQQIAYSNNTASAPTSVQIDWSFSDANSGAQGAGGPMLATGSTTVTIASPPMLASYSVESSAGGPAISQAQLDATLAAATALWTEVLGPDPAMLASLNELSVGMADLPGVELGTVVGSTILIDADAAGYGWFVDVSPAFSNEFSVRLDRNVFAAARSSDAFGRMDLLTVVLHELGHVLGFDHDDAARFAVMDEVLAPGVRYTLGKPRFDLVMGGGGVANAHIAWHERDGRWTGGITPYGALGARAGAHNLGGFQTRI